MSHDLEAIHDAAAKGWAADIESRIGKRKTNKPTSKP
jgi:hypothetical protein